MLVVQRYYMGFVRLWRLRASAAPGATVMSMKIRDLSWLTVGGLLLCMGLSIARADDAATIRVAWLKASSLVGRSDLPPVPTVRFTEPRRYVRLPGQSLARLCGETMSFDGNPIVFIYTSPAENGLAFNTLVHEFLHVLDNALGLRKNGQDPEAWVRSLWLVDCPAEPQR